MIDWSKIKHFAPDEFDDPDFPDSHQYMNPKTIQMLDNLRDETGWPIITHNKFGLRGCVCMNHEGHSPNSHHYYPYASAVDFHFKTDVDPRIQAMKVISFGFWGIGVYYDWNWKDENLPIGFHVDQRIRPQIWKRENKKYTYLLK